MTFDRKHYSDEILKNLYEAILDFQARERRFGKTGDQIKNEELQNIQ